MAISVSKPLAGGAGSVTTFVDNDYASGPAKEDQNAKVRTFLEACIAFGVVSSITDNSSRPDTTTASGNTHSDRKLINVATPRKEAIDAVLTLVNLGDNTQISGGNNVPA